MTVGPTYFVRADEYWRKSCSLVRHTYDTMPGIFLLWPGTRWRYQLSRDTLPAMLAVIDGRHKEFDGGFNP